MLAAADSGHTISSVINLYFHILGRVSKEKLPITSDINIDLPFTQEQGFLLSILIIFLKSNSFDE